MGPLDSVDMTVNMVIGLEIVGSLLQRRGVFH